jgi:hypothetical protein
VTIDTVLNLLGLALSLGGLLAARLTRQKIFTIIACALVVTTGVGSWLELKHEREVSRVETEFVARLSNNRWTLERISSEMHEPDPKLLREALSRALEDGTVNDQLTECTVNDGSVLSTRVYFNTAAQ